jgi:glycerophosphoryl diester phosphodiesterase
VPRLVSAAGCSVWSPNYRNVTAASLSQAGALRLQVIPWTVNERADMARLIEMGVNGIITDYPDRLRAVMIDKKVPVPPMGLRPLKSPQDPGLQGPGLMAGVAVG